MADNKKIYTIQINGIDQSIKQVDALSDALKALDAKIKDLESKNINVSSTSNGGGRTNSEFDAQDKLEKQILDTEQKIAQVRDENYKKLLHMKEELKEYTQIAKSNAAADENKQGLFDTNTMAGMKASLKSIKAEMQTLDVSSDRFRELTQEANGLNEKLKSIEQSYGQFGRNVGNYANGVADGLQQVVIKVGDVDRTFESAKQASRELGNELKTMAANGEQGTQEFKNLQKAVATLNSDMKDAMVSSRAMDNLLDTMKGFASVGQITQGFSALFGFDDSEIERSIQKLVALQNVMQGLEEINQQMQSGEGIGGWIAKGNDAIDAFTKKLLGSKTAQEGLNTTMTAGKTASEGLAAAETAQAAATTTATVATKALSLALKTIGIGLVISAVAYLITYWKEIYKWFTDTIPALKNLSVWFDKIKAVAMGVGNAILNYMVQPLATLVKVIQAVINGNFSEIPNIISNGVKKTFNIVGNFQKGYYRETERQQEAHNKKMREKQKEANEEFLKDEEAKYGKSHKRTQEYYKKQMALTEKGSKEYKELQRKLWEDERQEREENARKNVASSKRVTAQTKKIDFDAEKEIVRARIDAMKEGLNKTITQLEEERKARIAKIRENGKNYKEVEAEINALYDKKIEEEIKRHTKDVEKMYEDMYKNIRQLQISNAQKEVQINKENEGIALDDWDKSSRNKYFGTVGSYGVQGKDKLSQETMDLLGIYSQYNDEFAVLTKELVDKLRERETAFNEYDKLLNEQEIREKTYLKDKEEAEKEIQKIEETITNNEKTIVEKRSLIEDVKLGLLKDFNDKEIEAEIAKLETANKINAQLLENKEAYLDKLKGDFDADNEFLKTEIEKNKELLDNASNDYVEFKKGLEGEYGKDAVDLFEGNLLNESYSKDLSSLFNQRISAIKAYWEDRKSTVLMAAEDVAKSEMKLLKKSQEEEEKASDDNWRKQLEELDKWQEKKKELILVQAKKEKWTEEETNKSLNAVDVEYEKSSNTLYTSYQEERQKITEIYAQKEYQINKKKNDAIKKANAESHQNELQEFRDYVTALDESENKAETTGFLGFINVGKTNENYQKVLEGYESLAIKLREKRDKLNADFKAGLLDENVYESSIREVDRMTNQVGGKIEELKSKMDMKEAVGKLIAQISQFVQVVGQSLNQILSAVWDNQDAAFDNHMEELDKTIDAVREKYEQMDELAEEHRSNVDSIEDELSTARGDRRQQLIDQLNAEMSAERQALAEKKKAQKEEERLQAKKEKEEEKQKEREHKRAVTQAFINWHLSIASGLATQPFWPVGVAMGALATALGAVQYALIKSQKYAEGGVIQGKSHREGGVPAVVGNSPIELEGNEFIIRRKSTIPNLNLLDFVNRSEKKLSLEDLINFYTNENGMRKRVISNSPRTKYADGGQIATLRNDINLSDRLLTAFEDYSNRPQVVSVVEIVDKMSTVREVQAMAGLETNY